MKKKKEVFTVGGINYAARMPEQKERFEADRERNKAMRRALDSGAIVDAKVDQVIKDQGLWTQENEEEHDRLQKELKDAQHKVTKGGIKLTEGKNLALKCNELETKIQALREPRNRLAANTAENQAFNAYFNRLCSLCIVNNETNEPIFSSEDEYLNPEDEKKEIADEGASKLMYLLNGLSADYRKDLPQNKFLLKYMFVDEKLRSINKEGKLVDEDGRLVNEEGRFIDKDGNYVNRDGEPVDEAGNLLVEAAPFLDEEGRPV